MFLKTDTEELFVMSDGKVFQSVGAATEKDLAPYVFRLKWGITSRFLDFVWVLRFSFLHKNQPLQIPFPWIYRKPTWKPANQGWCGFLLNKCNFLLFYFLPELYGKLHFLIWILLLNYFQSAETRCMLEMFISCIQVYGFCHHLVRGFADWNNHHGQAQQRHDRQILYFIKNT